MSFAEALIPLFGIIFLFGFPVIAFIVHRVLKHQERIEMIRHGMAPSADFKQRGWAPSAPPQAPGRPIDPATIFGYEAYVAAQNQLRKGISTACIGLALFIGLSFIRLGEPGPWLLGGLIPMFVGIAQILIAMMSGARFTFGGPFPMPPSGISGPGPQSSQQPRDVTPGPYAYRPGTTTELEPPVPPPDMRR